MDMPLLEADDATVMDDEQKVVFANLYSYCLVRGNELQTKENKKI